MNCPHRNKYCFLKKKKNLSPYPIWKSSNSVSNQQTNRNCIPHRVIRRRPYPAPLFVFESLPLFPSHRRRGAPKPPNPPPPPRIRHRSKSTRWSNIATTPHPPPSDPTVVVTGIRHEASAIRCPSSFDRIAMRGLSVAARAVVRMGMGLRGRGRSRDGRFALPRCSSGMRSFGGAVVDEATANEKGRSVVSGDAWSCGGQRRWFLGCGDGEEGSVLSKIYEERRVIGYSPEQLYAVVAAVDLYQDFVPWCQRSKILKHNNDGSFDAELEIGFKFLVESYVSHVELTKPKLIKTTATESGLFDHLINIWEFNPGPVPGSCDLHFLVDFKFQSPIYRQVASMFFKEVVSRLVGSFTDRCQRIYGPGVQVLESSYGQGS